MAAHFLTIPAELRNRIYELVVIEEETIRFQHTAKSLQPPILRVCQQTRTECRQMYYERNTFIFLKPFNNFVEPLWRLSTCQSFAFKFTEIVGR